MCDVTYVALALSAIGTAVKYDSDKKSAATQQQMIEDGLEKDRAATSRLYEQIQESSQDEKAQRQTEYLIDKARIMSIQAESGLSGSSYDRAILDEAANADSDMAAIEKNRQWKAGNASSQSAAKGNQATIQMSGIKRPSSIGAGLQIAGYAADAYSHSKKT